MDSLNQMDINMYEARSHSSVMPQLALAAIKKMNKTITLLVIAPLIFFSCSNSNVASDESKKDSVTEQYKGPIIDMHLHAYIEENEFKNAKPDDPASVEEHQEQTFTKFKDHNIVKAVISPSPESWHEVDSSLVLSGILITTLLPSTNELKELHRNGKLDVLGELAPYYSGLAPTDEKIIPYFDLAVELDIPVALHMYPGGPPGSSYGYSPMGRAYMTKPLQLEEILVARPAMRIYIMHAGWPFLDDMKALMYAHPQVYVDLGVICWAIPRKEFHHFLKGLVDAGHGKRIMFGSDQMKVPSMIDTGIEAVNAADFLTLEQKEDIFYNNAARFLRLSDEEIKLHKEL